MKPIPLQLCAALFAVALLGCKFATDTPAASPSAVLVAFGNLNLGKLAELVK